MVAAHAASQAFDASTASELGWLLHAHVRIADPRWRLEAIVRLVPLLRRFGLSLDRYRTEIRVLAGRGHAPRPVRERVTAVLLAAIDSASVEALVRFVEALFVHDWPGSLTCAIAGALAMGDQALALELVAMQPHPRPMLAALARRGVIGDELVASVSLADVLEPSIPLLKAIRNAPDAERVAARLRPRLRPIAQALLARLEPTRRVAENRVRSIREANVQCFARLALSRAATDIDEARHWAATIEHDLVAQRARLDIARKLVAAGEHLEALQTLKTVLDPRLWAENLLARDEIRVARGRLLIRRWHQQKQPAWDVPTWVSTERVPSVEEREKVLFGVVLLSVAGTSSFTIDDAFWHLHPSQRDGAAAWIVRLRIDMDAVVPLSQEPKNARIIDALQSALIARRAAALAGSNLPVRGIADADPRSPARASHDEAVALSSDAARRRRVLISAAQACVRSALASPETWDAGVVETRLRTLVHLGGELGVGAIRAAVATHPAGRFSRLALEALSVAAPKVAAELLLARQSEWAACGIDVGALLQRVEVHHGVERGYALAYRAARNAIVERSMQRDPDWWLTAFFELWRVRFGEDPSVLVLRSVADLARVPKYPNQFLEGLDAVSSGLARRSHYETLEALRTSDTLLAAAMVATPARADFSSRGWGVASWREHLKTLADDEIRICDETLRRGARLLRRPVPAVARRELAGVPVVTELEAEQQRYRLRLLDKRVDILTYLRFADVPARSCFRSDGGSWFWSADAVANVWRDPLSLAFHVERARGESWKPCGFLFGSIVEVRDRFAIAFNSLHVRPNREPLRVAILEAAERALAPLRPSALAIANCHGGRGPLPPAYQRRDVQLHRLRALRQNGALQRHGDDDIGACNDTVHTTHLWWRDLE